MTAAALRFNVLSRREDIRTATRELSRRGWVQFGGSVERSRPAAVLRRALGRKKLLADPIKSWDVLRALEAVLGTTQTDSPILDLGSVACPLLPCLHELGYTDLHGVDLDPRVSRMAMSEAIDYRCEDMTSTPWPDETFAAITAISVIEHGLEQNALLDEVRRLLRPGGVFVFSTDYWPEKISTSGVRLFGLDWQIFSCADVEALLAAARERDLRPLADPSVALRMRTMDHPSSRPITFKGRHYTFLYGALKRGR